MYNKQLDVFICVADAGSFNKAAERLFISSTAVMKQINSLERNLDLKLIERTNQGIKLTIAGESIYNDAKYLLDYSNRSIEKAKMLNDASTPIISVGTSMLNPCKDFIDLWNIINKEFPGYKLNVVPFEDDHSQFLSVISSIGESIDFITGVCDSKMWLERCNFYVLGKHKFCCALPYGHKLYDKACLSIEDLDGENLIMVKRGDSVANDTLRDKLERDYPSVTIIDAPYFYDIEVFNQCEKENSILLTFDIWSNVHPSLKTIPVDWEYGVNYGVIYGKHPREDAVKVLECIKSLNR